MNILKQFRISQFLQKLQLVTVASLEAVVLNVQLTSRAMFIFSWKYNFSTVVVFLLSCKLKSCQTFPTTFKPTEIRIFYSCCSTVKTTTPMMPRYSCVLISTTDYLTARVWRPIWEFININVVIIGLKFTRLTTLNDWQWLFVRWTCNNFLKWWYLSVVLHNVTSFLLNNHLSHENVTQSRCSRMK